MTRYFALLTGVVLLVTVVVDALPLAFSSRDLALESRADPTPVAPPVDIKKKIREQGGPGQATWFKDFSLANANALPVPTVVNAVGPHWGTAPSTVEVPKNVVQSEMEHPTGSGSSAH
ncbi:hypothetical protein C8J56DRAFT_1033867 [Mycena floridula]|nr:hypothetical protein C8J56DRAFT_1033867 [Mycena floridula]